MRQPNQDPYSDEAIRGRAQIVWNRILDAGGSVDTVRILAITKALDPSAAVGAIAAGLFDLGESYVQEFAAKAPTVASSSRGEQARWHFVGGLQRNKINMLPPVELIHSIGSQKLATAVGSRREGQAVLVQVNIGMEAQKGGCHPDDTAALVDHCIDAGLDVQGLMGVARQAADDDTTEQFESLVRLADDLHLPVRSMGMSADLDLAVMAGSTMVRIGTALFGPRPPR
ncbi:MAG: YggS family pyridoxal phosphate-dependent enzyme [Actinobacteria bacterium]|nr:YggS family pyridoxal phosphate-dependent enzyme [Actinomycetota bacterium]